MNEESEITIEQYRARMKSLVDTQTILFNRDSLEEERIGIFQEIRKLQKERP